MSAEVLETRFLRALESVNPPSGPGIVAVSGGPDSLALLHLLVATAGRHAILPIVAHLDHGIDPDSGIIADRVRAHAGSLGLGFECEQIRLGLDATETEARVARYRWLREIAHQSGARSVLTGHHADDQAETVLMRVLHGSGPAGLAGMAPRNGMLIRPLLAFRRCELERYLTALGIDSWADPANEAPRHLRSWIRGELLPIIEARLPDARESIERLGVQASASRRAWDQVLDELPIGLRAETGGFSVASGPLRAYDTALAVALIQALARRSGHTVGPQRAARVLTLVRDSASGARIELGLGWLAELRFDRLALVKSPPVGASFRLSEASGEQRMGAWRVRWCREPAPGPPARTSWTAWFAGPDYQVGPWQPGDRIRPLGGTGHRRVVRCLQEARVAKSERSGWPVVSSQGTIIWVPGVCRSGAALPAPHEEAVRIDVDRE